MSAVVDTGGGGRGSASQDFDLNLAPIIDSFVVLIAFMLISASFLSIGILDAGVAAAGAPTAAATPPPVNVTIELQDHNKVVVKVSGKEEARTQIAAVDGAYNFEAMQARLDGIKKKWGDVNAVTLLAEESVAYKDVVQVMEKIRKAMPVVLLGGF